MLVDSETELFSTSATSQEFIYNYRLVNYSQSELDISEFEKGMKISLLDSLCSSPEALEILDYDVIMKYRYHDQTKVLINEIGVNKNECTNL